MFKTKEILLIILFSILLGALVQLRTEISELLNAILIGILSFFIIISINVITKKLTARYLDTSIEIKSWQFKRIWFKSAWYFKKKFPAGVFFPLISTFFSLGYFVWMAVLTFDPSPLSSRVTKRHGLYRFSELTERHIAFIAAAGVSVSLLSSIIFYFVGFSELAKFSIYFACWNLVPLGDLDGSKILFGGRILWYSLVIIALVFLMYAIFLI